MRTFRVYAQIVYKYPRYDAKGFPANDPLVSYDKDVAIFSQEMEELVAEINATSKVHVHVKLLQLRRENIHVAEFVTDCPGCSVVEL